MISMAEALPREQARVREILSMYKEIGPAGVFGAAMIEESLRNADMAAASGDAISMIVALQDLRGIN